MIDAAGFDIFPASYWPGRNVVDATRLGQAEIHPGPKVSFASVRRWGTEPEGWYVDLPYAIWVGVNYSPKVDSPYRHRKTLSTEINKCRVIG